MATISDLITENSNLNANEVEHLSELVAEWRLLADLSFADLLLWLPIRRDEKSWPEGHLVIAQIRPTTAATIFADDLVGTTINWGQRPLVDQALSEGEIIKDTKPELVGQTLIKEETIPVIFNGRILAVVSRHRNADLMRQPSKLELNYREIAHKIYKMVAEGNFPIRNSLYSSESSPRVGDGLIRLDVNGVIFFASPNARSALSRIGFHRELEGENLGAVFSNLNKGDNQPTDESWQTVLNGKSLRRVEYESQSAVLDILVIPLTEGNDRIGAIVLVHNITELRYRDRALVTKDATIKEIHHRVKNNLNPRIIAYKKIGVFGSFDSKTATALSLVITELIHNALEHGLNESGDELTVEINKNGNQYQVSICDNGPGLPRDFSIEKSANLGLQIANTLTKNELNGSINLVRIGNLTRGDISFKTH